MPPPHHTQRPAKAKESLEQRRARGEISCAECRQHKVKCDKAIPCGTCVRKGCQHLCPNGTTARTDASRTGPLKTDAFNARLAAMSGRIRQLEDALQTLHSSVSTGLHPLLEEEHSALGNHLPSSSLPKTESDITDTDSCDPPHAMLVKNPGTAGLNVGCPDVTDVLLVVCSCVSCLKESSLTGMKRCAQPSDASAGSDSSGPVSAFCSCQSEAFPFTPLHLPAETIQTAIEGRLPSYARASALVEAYLENLSWFFRPVDREQIMEELLPAIYKRRRQMPEKTVPNYPPRESQGEESPTDPHALAVLFAIFAAGAAADLTLPPWNDEADMYHHLSRTALSIKPVFEGSGLNAVQAVALIAGYDLFSCRKNNLEGTWKILSFSLSLAAAIGLNRDPTNFKLPPKLVQRRRRLFWELRSLDVCKTICTGWPLSFTSDVIDCEFPKEADVQYGENGTELPGSIWWFRYRFIRDVMTEVVSKLGAAHPVKYSEILALDQKIRNFNPGPLSNLPRKSRYFSNGRHIMSQAQIGLMKDMALLLLHRNFFVRALVEDPTNPIRTQFGPSFVSTFRSASSFLTVVREVFIEHSANFLMRVWPIWAHALSASVMLGSIAACGSPPDLASEAYHRFNLTFEMFSQMQMHPVIKCGLPVLQRLREHAQRASVKREDVRSAQASSDVAMLEHTKSENDVVAGIGKMVRRGLEGEFGTVKPRLRPSLHISESTDAHSTSSGEQLSSAFTSTPEPSPLEPGSSSALRTAIACTAAQDEGMSEQSYSGKPPYRSTEDRYNMDVVMTPASTSAVSATPGRSQEPTLQIPRSEYRFVTSEELSPMEVSRDVYSPSSSSSTLALDGEAHKQFSDDFHSLYPESPSISDAFNTFTAFSNIPTGSGYPASDSTSGFPQTQEPSLSTFDSDPFFTGTSAYGDVPDLAFDSDFDVSFNMRTPTGQDDVLPLLPEDMEAWRLILQDSRFFGNVGGNPQEGGGSSS